MKPFVKSKFRDHARKDQEAQTSTPRSPPSARDILRYRYQHGTNLGGIFVLERWLHGSMFDAEAHGDSELDAVTSSIKVRGVDQTRAKWEAHWSNSLSEDDLHWLSEVAHCTTIRFPIGYFTLGPDFCQKTPFSGQLAHVYLNAWASVKQIVSNCTNHGIGVLLDFHALPGGANGEAHSGTSSNRASLWGNKFNLDLAIMCFTYVAQEVKDGMQGVVGLQLCNEAGWNAPGMYKFYDTALTKISQIDPSLPIYISDGWDLERALRYSLEKNSVKDSKSNPVIVDTHKYYTFAEKDTSRHPQELIGQVSTELSELSQQKGNVFDNKGAMAIFVGEYSCTLSGQTWSRVRAEDRSPMTKQFGQSQSQTWHQRSCGSAFWTFKMDWMPGGDWGFREQVENGSIMAPANLLPSAAEVREKAGTAEHKREELMSAAMQSHQDYWDRANPNGRWDHWRYAEGWHWGWQDARDFFYARTDGVLSFGHERTVSNPGGGDRIGALDLWVLKRMKEAKCGDKSSCGLGWEWEQGFRRGIDQFYLTVGLRE